MNLINPNFKLQKDNIFNIRKKEFIEIENVIREMLIPAQELGFEIKEFGIKNSKYVNGELKRTFKDIFSIKLKRGNSDINISQNIPTLIDDNYIMINGRKKIPLFQLFDIPIVTRGKNIKIRTNICTIMIIEEKEFPFINVSIFSKKVPLAELMFSYYSRDELKKRFNLINPTKIKLDNIYSKFLDDLMNYDKNYPDYSQDDFIREVGKRYSKYNSKSKGEDLIYAFDNLLKVDIMSAKFFNSTNLLEEIINTISGNSFDDLDYVNKRIRCFEYIVTSKFAKDIFTLCQSNRTTRQVKFNVNSSEIISSCNVSDIIQFDFSINPIEELTKLSRTSLVGPDGFNRQNIPKHLRDISPSMFGRICSVDTPDRDNCGVLQNLLPNTKLDKNLKFTQEKLDKQTISIPVSMVPFLEHNDQTRLQMSASQMRQSIMLKEFDQPMIKSGCENLYTDYTQFIKKSKKNGIVVYVDNKFIILIYDDKEVDIFNIEYRKIYTENLDLFNVYVKQGDKVKKGDILAESNFCKDGSINIGKNLLTAVMVYYGYNYEDGIIISDRLIKEGLMTSVHYKDLSFRIPENKLLLSLNKEEYKPLPDPEDFIKTGNPYAILKNIPDNPLEFNGIFEEKIELLVKKDLWITEVNIYANNWNDSIPEYKNWIENKIQEQHDSESKLQGILEEYIPKEKFIRFIRQQQLDKFSSTGKYKIKGEIIDGIHVEMYGMFFRQIQVGDKIGNRHGNKGVISQIVEHKKMPKLKDGRHVDICINPLGIISRMNIGQLYELHLGMSLWDLKQKLYKKIKNNSQEEVKKYLINYIKIIDNSEKGWLTEQFENKIKNEEINNDFIKNLSLIQPPFEACNPKKIMKALKYTGTKFEYDVFDPISGLDIINPIAAGYMYFFRMVHIAESKMSARGIGSYARKTLQPLAGRKNKGGQRLGEMETACLISHDAPENLFEFLTTKSDCIDLKNKFIKELVEVNSMLEDDKTKNDIIPESVKLFYAYLTVCGLKK